MLIIIEWDCEAFEVFPCPFASLWPWAGRPAGVPESIPSTETDGKDTLPGVLWGLDQRVSIKIITAFFVSSDFLHRIKAELSNLQREKLSILQMLKAGKGNCSRCVLHGIGVNAHQVVWLPREVQSGYWAASSSWDWRWHRRDDWAEQIIWGQLNSSLCMRQIPAHKPPSFFFTTTGKNVLEMSGCLWNTI